MYERILIPVDESEGAKRGVRYGLSLAEEFDAEVHTVFVVDERRFGDSPAVSSDELFLEQVESRGESAMEDLVEQAAARGLESHSRCVRGTPANEILAYADEHDIDVIVMGIHGRKQRDIPFIGSTTERTLRGSNIPVFPV